MSLTIREHGPQLRATETAHSCAGVALRSAESQLLVFASSPSLRQDVGHLQWDRICCEAQCELDTRCGGRTGKLQDSPNERSRTQH